MKNAKSNKDKAETAIFIAHEDFEKTDEAESERNLMRAILQAAMDDIRKKGDPQKEALKYFSCGDDAYIYSFLSICNQLELCPKTIKSILGVCQIESKYQDKYQDKQPQTKTSPQTPGRQIS